MASNSGYIPKRPAARALIRVRLIHEPTDEVHRETLVLPYLVVIYDFRRDSMGFNTVRQGHHLIGSTRYVRELVAKLPDLKRKVDMCECVNHADYRMELDYAVQE